MQITLYTTHCPKCKVLAKKLEQKNIMYCLNDNIEEMQQKGFMEAPKLEVDGKLMDFSEANRWIGEQ